MTCVLLTDNGSKQAAATLQLRQIAHDLGQRCARTIHPVSLQHADQIDPGDLAGIPAQVFRSFIEGQLIEGERDFIVLPLFFGVSRALTSFIPECVEALKLIRGDFRLQVADVLYPLATGEPLLVNILQDHITHAAQCNKLPVKNVVLVDHGSPIPEVTEVRKRLARDLRQSIGNDLQLQEAVMERRKGDAYDFNGSLLEDVLIAMAEAGEASTIVALLFLLPGRHAGANGDIQSICAGVMQNHANLTIHLTPLVAEHEILLDILQARLKAVSQ